tara:strand:- start:1363 stop:1755 length:393 start_codon:yes stop_codon:yes gene_type:complete
MDSELARSYFLSLPGAKEDFPFNRDIPVFKIKKKMFGFLRVIDGVGQINLKCKPEEAIILRDIFVSVIPGYHMNKDHWNTVILDGKVPSEEIERMIDTSYSLVIKNLKSSLRKELEIKYGKNNIYLCEQI